MLAKPAVPLKDLLQLASSLGLKESLMGELSNFGEIKVGQTEDAVRRWWCGCGQVLVHERARERVSA